MPIRAYACLKCKEEFEELYTSFAAEEREEPDVKCPKCGSLEKERLVSSGTSFKLNGNGWAKDLYSSGIKGKRGSDHG